MRVLILLMVLAGAAVGQDAPKLKVSDLGWISGCWEMSKGTSVTVERWGKPSSNMMIGTSQTTKDGRTVAFEFIRIAAGPEGLAYIARPSGAKDETVFAAVRDGGKEIVFENLKHDFPQRIIYKQEKAGTLFARIEGPRNGKTAGIDYSMTRISCD